MATNGDIITFISYFAEKYLNCFGHFQADESGLGTDYCDKSHLNYESLNYLRF